MATPLKQLTQAFDAEKKSLYLVGGSVRDAFLQRTNKDIDCTTNALPPDIKKIAAKTSPQSIVLVGEAFGTIQLRYPDNIVVEITPFRDENYSAESRKPTVSFGTTLECDLQRRDFTMNAIAQNLANGQVIDIVGGLKDLKDQIIRAVGDPEARFKDDPLRLLRAIRFAAQLKFQIESNTWHALVKNAALIESISKERIQDELIKILLSENAKFGLRLLYESSVLQHILPEVAALVGVDQKPYHHLDVFDHTLLVVEGVPNQKILKLAALFHDIAKPQTKTIKSGITHFYRHEEFGAEMANDIMRRLCFKNEDIKKVTKLIAMHMRINSYLPSWSTKAVRHLIIDAGDLFNDLLDLAIADGISDRTENKKQILGRLYHLQQRAKQTQDEFQTSPVKSPLTGNELMTLFNLHQGPWIKHLKEHLYNLVLDQQLNGDDKIGAYRAAKQFMSQNNR